MPPLLANVVWPSLLLEVRALAWWIIGLGLVVEFFFVLKLTRSTLRKAAVMTVAMNAASTFLGVIGTPLSGILWELVASITIYPLVGWGTFNPLTWLVSSFLAAALNAGIEVWTLRRLFRLPKEPKLIGWLFLANLITVGVALATIFYQPPEL